MKNILGNAIKDLRKSKKLTQKQLSELTGYKQNTISNHENGNRQLDENDIRVYAKALDVSPQTLFDKTNPRLSTIPSTTPKTVSDDVLRLDKDLHSNNHKSWIRYGNALLDKQNTVTDSKNTVNELQATYHTYNYYDQPASAGTGQYLNDVKVETIELPIEVDADFVVPIYGDSMEPEYHSGDYVFVKLSVDLSDGDIGVFAYNGDAYIKQLRITDQGAYLHSLNPDYDNIPITADTDFRTIGEVVGVYRER
ncbi:XRE family transcriptional regulator [Streptococcus suis]|uniref:XRE family transcriptional regulator n=2 Tax=Streptococcus suis TaxID=1307 RepID=UPI0006B45ADE|nr:S24 family peptidase [Streptococcus suis]AML47543.1 repressor [Streptococcus suis]KPA55310.1 repressor [Streptococcus suis]MBL1132408.1 helix-turn-helix transcriptional regulator [Streptococcus suis]MCH1722004.1 helix-turn-helix domain-containing protein [Streptococcus suis]MCL4913429.1 helix-turn-helix domain-containing protein [Streptococcus suis]